MAVRLRHTALLAALLASSCDIGQIEERALFHPQGQKALTPTAVEPSELPVHGEVYIPIYSRVYRRAERADLSATLIIHNADSGKPLVLLRIDYHDSLGEKIRGYLDAPAELPPLATVDVSVGLEDRAGAAGANFIVAWGARQPIAEPVMEAIMLGQIGTRSVSLVSTGRPVELVGKTE